MNIFSPWRHHRDLLKTMKLHKVLPAALIACAAFATPSHAQDGLQIFNTILRAVIETQRQQPAEPQGEPNANQQAASSSTDVPAPQRIAQTTAAAAMPGVGGAKQADWTPMFKSWERGCEFTPELGAFVEGLKAKRVVLPASYKPAAGKVTSRISKGIQYYKLPLKGSYYGLPVDAFEYFFQPETDNIGFSLLLAADKQTVKNTLSRVKYLKGVDPVTDNESQATISLDGKQPSVECY